MLNSNALIKLIEMKKDRDSFVKTFKSYNRISNELFSPTCSHSLLRLNNLFKHRIL